jgi:hypothetical protein
LEDNINMDLQEVGWESMDWTDLAQDRDRWWALSKCGKESSGSTKCGEFLDNLRTGWLLKDFAPRSK